MRAVHLAAVLVAGVAGTDPGAGLATIRAEDLAGHLAELAAPHLEGRDSPSAGLERAAAYIEARMRAAGLHGIGPGGPAQSLRRPFPRDLTVPDEPGCELEVRREDGARESLVLGRDFVPLPGCTGRAEGAPVFVGFGISGTRERYDDLRGVRLAGRVAVVLEGEPRHRRLFDGPEVTEASDVYGKLEELEDAGAVGVLVVRRTPAEPVLGADGEPLAPPAIGYRHSWAPWNRTQGIRPVRSLRHVWDLPVLEVSEAVASRLLGVEVAELARRIDEDGKPLRHEPEGVTLRLAAAFRGAVVSIDNVVGALAGVDPQLADEFLVIGAHYDHIGVDPWGRVACGADDNASGTAALLELAEALAAAGPRRSILFAAFAAEEDGLIGSRAFCLDPPVALDSVVCMLNMDMVGRGDAAEVFVLGTRENPALAKVLKRARKLGPTGLERVVTGKPQHLWERSDHFPFHQAGVPALFFFESGSELDNADYHTYRDTIAALDVDKIANTTRLIFNTAWLLADDDERPPRPRR